MSATLLLRICVVDLVFDFNAYVPKGAFQPDQLSAFIWLGLCSSARSGAGLLHSGQGRRNTLLLLWFLLIHLSCCFSRASCRHSSCRVRWRSRSCCSPEHSSKHDSEHNLSSIEIRIILWYRHPYGHRSHRMNPNFRSFYFMPARSHVLLSRNES